MAIGFSLRISKEDQKSTCQQLAELICHFVASLTRLELVAEDVVLLEEDVLAAVELGLVLVAAVEVPVQAHHPQTLGNK